MAALNTINVLGGTGVSTSASGNTILINAGAPTFTPGSVIFAGATGALSQDNPNFIYDSVNHRLGIGGAIVPTNTLTVHGSSYFDGNISQVGTGDTVALAATTIQFWSFGTGIAHISSVGNLSSSAIALASI